METTSLKLGVEKPRVLVVVRGGVVDHVADDGVDIEVFDWDNYNVDPKGTGGVPAHFADVAKDFGIPVDDDLESTIHSQIKSLAKQATQGGGLPHDVYVENFSQMVDSAYPPTSPLRDQAVAIARSIGHYASPEELKQAQVEMAQMGCCTHGLNPDCCPRGCGELPAKGAVQQEESKLSWTEEDSIQACKQGWDIFNCSGGDVDEKQLQRNDDDMVFANDGLAAQFVKERAAAGDPLAKKAIAYLVQEGSSDVERFKFLTTTSKTDNSVTCPNCSVESEITGLVGHGTNQCPACGNPVFTSTFAELQHGSVFNDVANGGKWVKFNDHEAVCVEDDSAYRTGEKVNFAHDDQVRKY